MSQAPSTFVSSHFLDNMSEMSLEETDHRSREASINSLMPHNPLGSVSDTPFNENMYISDDENSSMTIARSALRVLRQIAAGEVLGQADRWVVGPWAPRVESRDDYDSDSDRTEVADYESDSNLTEILQNGSDSDSTEVVFAGEWPEVPTRESTPASQIVTPRQADGGLTDPWAARVDSRDGYDSDSDRTEVPDNKSDSDCTDMPDDVTLAGEWPELASRESTPVSATIKLPIRSLAKLDHMIYPQGTAVPLPVIETNSAMLIQLMRRPVNRMVVVNTPRGVNNRPRSEYLIAIWLQAVGDVKPVPCARCAKGRGIFKECVAISGVLRGSCANCWWGSGARVVCDSRTTITKDLKMNRCRNCEQNAKKHEQLEKLESALARMGISVEEVDAIGSHQLAAMIAMARRDLENTEQQRLAEHARWSRHYTYVGGDSYQSGSEMEREAAMPSTQQSWGHHAQTEANRILPPIPRNGFEMDSPSPTPTHLLPFGEPKGHGFSHGFRSNYGDENIHHEAQPSTRPQHQQIFNRHHQAGPRRSQGVRPYFTNGFTRDMPLPSIEQLEPGQEIEANVDEDMEMEPEYEYETPPPPGWVPF